MTNHHGLDGLYAQGLIDALDLGFARLIERCAETPCESLLWAAALTSRAAGDGHTCIHLAQWAGRIWGDVDGSPLAHLPDLATWRGELLASGMVGDVGEDRPLILDSSGRLYLQRYWNYQYRLAENLRRRARSTSVGLDAECLRRGLRRLYPDMVVAPDWQQVAAAVAVMKPLCVISGGPGTGKTTTLVRILALLIEQSLPDVPRIALVAPTGKAAARMQGAVAAALPSLDVDPRVRDAIPVTAGTIHRLLGVRAADATFRHHADNRLVVDAVVVDEASMVDLALMTKLVEALPYEARLILLGDRDQLASVEAGAVLADLCVGAEGFTSGFRMRLESLLGYPIPPDPVSGSGLVDNVVLLRRSYRFDASSGIGWLAGVVNRGAASELSTLFTEGRQAEVEWRAIHGWREIRQAFDEMFDRWWGEYWRAVGTRESAMRVLSELQAFRILAATRRGPAGVAHINTLIENLLRERRLVRSADSWYPGRPVMVVENDYGLGLFNGDVGVAMPDRGGVLRVRFESLDGGRPRVVSPSRLPRCETVYAMTVHKSQGSEFDRALLLLPEEQNSGMTRELIYTAATRARAGLEIWGSPRILEQAVKRRVIRGSGLADMLEVL